jgi:hypothetical protein
MGISVTEGIWLENFFYFSECQSAIASILTAAEAAKATTPARLDAMSLSACP